jgi:predicted PurR-regulated permease PerM
MNYSTVRRPARPLSTLTKVFILFIPVVLILAFAALFTGVFITFILCMLISFVLNPLVDYLESVGINRSISIIFVFAIIALIVSFVFRLVIPDIAEQWKSLGDSFKGFDVNEKLKSLEDWLRKNIPFLSKIDIAKELQAFIAGSAMKAQDLVSGVLSTAFFIFIFPFVTFFILRDRQILKRSFINIVPNKYFEMTVNIMDKLDKQLSRYVRGWLFDAAFVGILSILGLSLLGINNAVVIGLIAGAGHLIPYAGPIVGGIPAILISIIQFGDFRMVLPIVVLFAIIYFLDNSIAQPYILAKSVDMNPVTVIVLLLLGNELLGPFGALMAIPIASVLKVCARETINGFRNYKLGYY